jgi:GT2 family glycosyltransferase
LPRHPPGVSIVIPTWNGRYLLQEFLPSVIAAAQRYRETSDAPVEIVVVDDGSSDDTRAWLEGLTDEDDAVRAVWMPQNRGFGAACNAGAAAARHPRMLLLNNDLMIEPDAIAPLVAHLDRSSPLGPMFAVHCRMRDISSGDDVGTGKVGRFSRGFLRVHGSYVAERSAARPLPSMFATGGAAMFDRTAFLDIGGFDLLFAPFYLEDVELSYRAWKRGWAVGYEPDALVHHRFSSTIGAFNRTMIHRVSHRNRLLFHWLHLDDRRWRAQHVVMVALLAIWSVVSMRWAFVRGLADALGKRRAVASRRATLRQQATRSDRQVISLFATLSTRSGITTYESREELARRQKKRPT